MICFIGAFGLLIWVGWTLFVDFFGCSLGHVVEVVDVEQAYIQAEMKGDPTWVCLPPEARPEW
jgi:hypothetical protein